MNWILTDMSLWYNRKNPEDDALRHVGFFLDTIYY